MHRFLFGKFAAPIDLVMYTRCGNGHKVYYSPSDFAMPTWNSLTDDAEPVFLSADGSFLSAVRAKYDHKQGSTEGGELVGGDKTGSKQALDKLTRVFVREAAIAHAGPAGEIAATCGAIQELEVWTFAG